jgi:hypothetical protein
MNLWWAECECECEYVVLMICIYRVNWRLLCSDYTKVSWKHFFIYKQPSAEGGNELICDREAELM